MLCLYLLSPISSCHVMSCSHAGSLWRWDAAHAMVLGHSNPKVYIEQSYSKSSELVIGYLMMHADASMEIDLSLYHSQQITLHF